MEVEHRAQKLADYVCALEDFHMTDAEIGFTHMGALISDALLQAGVAYDSVVWPRVERLQEMYLEASTTSAFLDLVKRIGCNDLLDWKGTVKPERILNVAAFFAKEKIETVEQLRCWLQSPSKVDRLKQLSGIGNKTADYFKMLAGIETCAVDLHLLSFLLDARIQTAGYEEAQAIINRAADILDIDRRRFDHSIWSYKSRRRRRCN